MMVCERFDSLALGSQIGCIFLIRYQTIPSSRQTEISGERSLCGRMAIRSTQDMRESPEQRVPGGRDTRRWSTISTCALALRVGRLTLSLRKHLHKSLGHIRVTVSVNPSGERAFIYS
jgi:hypothetical protein